MSSRKKILIRPAERNDFDAIHALVVELAIYEKEPDAVTATISDFQKAFDDNLIQALVAEVGDEIIGMGLFYLTFSTWKGKMMYLEDLVVGESARNEGVGQLLFDAVIAKSKAQNCRLLKWQVLDWNEPAIKFYEKNNAIIDKEWWNGKMFF